MHVVVLLLLILILFAKFIWRVSFSFFVVVVITRLVKYGGDSKINRKKSSNCLAVGARSFGFQNINLETFPSNKFVAL